MPFSMGHRRSYGRSIFPTIRQKHSPACLFGLEFSKNPAMDPISHQHCCCSMFLKIADKVSYPHLSNSGSCKDLEEEALSSGIYHSKYLIQNSRPMKNTTGVEQLPNRPASSSTRRFPRVLTVQTTDLACRRGPESPPDAGHLPSLSDLIWRRGFILLSNPYTYLLSYEGLLHATARRVNDSMGENSNADVNKQTSRC